MIDRKKLKMIEPFKKMESFRTFAIDGSDSVNLKLSKYYQDTSCISACPSSVQERSKLNTL